MSANLKILTILLWNIQLISKKGEIIRYGRLYGRNMPKVGNIKTEVMGMAVFDGARMVGELDGEETSYYLMVEGKYGYSYVTIPIQAKDMFVLLNLKQSRKPKKGWKWLEINRRYI